MSIRKRVANPQVLVNNNPILVIPNSVNFTEGLGEQTVEPHSAGGDSIQTVFADNVAERCSAINFEMANTEQHINLIRSWKQNENENTIVITGDDLSRTFKFAALVNNYDVGLGADTNISLEWKSDPAV